MADRALWRRFLALPNDSRAKALGVAFLVALVCAASVSVTSVLLKPRQQAHLVAAREANLAAMVAALPGLDEILRASGAQSLQTVLVDLRTGTIERGADAAAFDYVAAQTDPAQSTALPPEADTAGIGRLPNRAPVYLLRGTEGLALVVLAIYGTGYQSTIRAFLALEGDLNTVAALTIHEQGETPGIGTRITNPEWMGLWAGRQVANAEGEVVIRVVRGAAASAFEVDGITGATRSTTGVSNLVGFWLGPQGFGPFLARLKAGEE